LYAAAMVLVYPLGTPTLYYILLRRHKPRLDRLRVNQALRVQLLEEVRILRDYDTSSVSTSNRRIPWLVSKSERATLPMRVRRRLRQLERDEVRERKGLPGTVAKLLQGYELRVWWFEIFECFRKLAVACLPVFFQPSGSASQLIYGLMICFICFGVYVHFDPFEARDNDWVARLCQLQIFFSLLASVGLSTSSEDAGSNLDVLLVVLWLVPVGMALFLESPLLKVVQGALDRWWNAQKETGTWDRLRRKALAVAAVQARETSTDTKKGASGSRQIELSPPDGQQQIAPTASKVVAMLMSPKQLVHARLRKARAARRSPSRSEALSASHLGEMSSSNPEACTGSPSGQSLDQSGQQCFV